MKIIHTSDWHLGNSFHGHSREAEHAHFLGWLTEKLTQQQPDALIISGDIFDSANPSAAAENMFYEFLARAGEVVKGIQVVVIAGNHDSGGRLEAPAGLLKMHNVYVRGMLKTTPDGEPDYESYVNFWMPFLDYDFGLHDATWRWDFGGDIRFYDGSHGCVNLPYDAAAELFDIVEVGDPVVVRE